MTTQEYHSPLYQDYRRHMIDAVRLAGLFDGLYYAEIDGMIDFDIKPSRYPAVTIKRIKTDYYYRKFPYCLKV
jgi:hypothetical protein